MCRSRTRTRVETLLRMRALALRATVMCWLIIIWVTEEKKQRLLPPIITITIEWRMEYVCGSVEYR